MTDSPSLETISADAFRAQLNQTFDTETHEGQSVQLELREAVGLKGDTLRGDKSPFSVLFRGPAEPTLDQQTVSLKNDAMGELLLFVVPLGPDPDHDERGMLYEAVFT